MPRYIPAILLALLFFAFVGNVASKGPAAIAAGDGELNKEIEGKLDLGNQNIEQTAVTMARDYPGEFSINQVGAIYNSLAEGWSYYNDPNFGESYKNANLTLQDGVKAGTVGVGDCDDFAILIASLIESLGGSTRIIFSQDEESGQGHAYAELYLGKKDDPHIEDLKRWIRDEYGVASITGLSPDGEDIWLNLDYNGSIPGGPFFGGEKATCKIAWMTNNKTAPKIIPLIDPMDNLSGWMVLKDDMGSNASISLVPSKKGKAINLSFDLKENGWAGIYRDIKQIDLAELKGIDLSYFANSGQTTLEIRLEEENGTAFSSIQPIRKNRPQWDYIEVLFEDLRNMDPEGTDYSDNKIDPTRTGKLEFIIHNRLEKGDIPGSGSITLDQIRGVMQVPKVSPWSRVEEERRQKLALDLASKSELHLGDNLNLAALLAIESVKYRHTLPGDNALRNAWSLLRGSTAKMSHNGTVEMAIFSPDGSYIATASDDGTARVWNSENGQLLATLRHEGPVNKVAFSPDSEYIATVSSDKTVRVWSSNKTVKVWRWKTGELLYKIAQDWRECVLDFSPDGKYLATASVGPVSSEFVRMWDAKTGMELGEMCLQSGKINDVKFSPDGKRLAAGGRDGGPVRIWNTSSFKEPIAVQHSEAIKVVAFSPDGKLLATASDNGTMNVWDPDSGELLATMDHEGMIKKIAFSPYNEYIATAFSNKTATVRLVKTGEPVYKVSQDNGINALGFSPDGKYLTTAGEGFVKLWDSRKGAQIGSSYNPGQEFTELYFSPNEKWLAAVGLKGGALIWNLSSFGKPLTIQQNQNIRTLAFSPDGGCLAAAGEDGAVTVWSLDPLHLLFNVSHNASVNSIAFSADGEYLATGSSDNVVMVWDREDGDMLATLTLNERVNALTFSPDDKYLITAGNRSVQMWEWYSKEESVVLGEEFVKLMELNISAREHIAMVFSPDGTRLSSIDKNGQVQVWNLSSFKNFVKMYLFGPAIALAFSPDGRYIAAAEGKSDESGHYYYRAQLWDAFTGKKTYAENYYDKKVDDVEFSPDGTLVASACSDGTAGVMKVECGCENPRLLGGSAVAFSNGGSLLATGGEGGTARIWDVKTSRELARIVHPEAGKSAVKSVAFSKKDTCLLTAAGNSAWLWDVEKEMKLPSENGSKSIRSEIFSLDGTRLVTVTKNYDYTNTATLWQVKEGKKAISFAFDGDDILLSPQDSYLAASHGETAYLWNVTSGRRIAALSNNPRLGDAAFRQNRTIIATTIGQMIHVWDIDTKEELARMACDGYVYFAAFSPDGRYLATAGDEGIIIVWETETGKRLFNIENVSMVEQVEFSRDSKRLAVMSDYNTTIAWDIEAGKELIRTMESEPIGDYSTPAWAFSPDGKKLATASRKNVKILDVDTGKLISVISAKYCSNDVEFSLDSKFLATTRGKSAWIWDVATGQEIAGINHTDYVKDVEFSPDGERLATASQDTTARVWDVATGQEMARINHTDNVEKVKFSPDGTKLAMACSDGTVWVWNGTSARELARMDYSSDISLEFNPDATRLIAAMNPVVAQEWNATTGQELGGVDYVGREYTDIDFMTFSPDERYLATASGRVVKVWDAKTGIELFNLTRDSEEKKLVFGPDGRLFFMISNKAARVVNITTGEDLKRFNLSRDQTIINPDGNRMAFKGYGNGVRIYDLNTTKLIFTIPENESKKVMSFNLDGTRLATKNGNGTILIWDVDSGEILGDFKTDYNLENLAFSPDGKIISSIDHHNSSLRIWDMAGEEIARYEQDIPYPIFSPDGRYLAASMDNATKVWHYLPEDIICDACSRLVRKNLTPVEWNTYLPGEPYHETCT